jgi:hypothetical protein
VAFPGAFSLAAGPAFLVASRRLAASPGAFLVVGPPTTLRAARRAQVTSGGFSLTGYAVGNGIPPTSFRATVLVNGVMRPATQAEVGIGRAPVVLVSGRLRQRVAGEGTPVVAATLGGSTRYRLLRATEALEI